MYHNDMMLPSIIFFKIKIDYFYLAPKIIFFLFKTLPPNSHGFKASPAFPGENIFKKKRKFTFSFQNIKNYNFFIL